MSASFNLILDTQAPANPSLLINGGAAVTGERDVYVDLTTSDAGPGGDVYQVKIWGDVDPTADPAFSVSEADSRWLPFESTLPVLLSAGSGRKHLYARLRDDVGNETLPFSDFIDLNTSVPVVSVTTAVDRGRISKISPFHQATFTWDVNVAFLTYQVRLVPSHGSPHQAGVQIGSTHGSINVQGVDRIEALTPVTTTITGADLEAASPGDGPKIVKVFVRGIDGTWSP